MYSELYRAWKAEKTSAEPQPLPADFYLRADIYLRTLEQDSTSSEEQTFQGRLLTKEKEVSARLLEDIKETRLKKIVSASRDRIAMSLEELTDEEKTLAGRVNESVKSFKKSGLPTSAPLLTPPQEETLGLTVVRFLADIPEIVGVDLRIYGPYRREDVGSLPTENAMALIKQGAARAIEVSV